MTTEIGHFSRRRGWVLLLVDSALLWAVALIPLGAVQADVITQLYSFETLDANNRPDSFAPNSGGIFSQDTIGTTSGAHSIKISYPAGPGFSGMLTTLIPAGLGDPPGVDYILFDLTLTQVIAPEAFVDIGIMMFGATQPGPDQQFGLQAQFDDYEQIGDLEVGTHTDLRIDLDSSFHPVTFNAGTFNDIFGTEGSGPDDMIPTGFQMYFNYTPGNMFPFTLYIDNIRAGRISEGGLSGDFNNDTVVDGLDYALWRNHLGEGDETNINNNGDGSDIGESDFELWKQQYGQGTPPGGGGIAAGLGVPEPSSLLLLLIAGVYGWGTRRGQETRRFGDKQVLSK